MHVAPAVKGGHFGPRPATQSFGRVKPAKPVVPVAVVVSRVNPRQHALDDLYGERKRLMKECETLGDNSERRKEIKARLRDIRTEIHANGQPTALEVALVEAAIKATGAKNHG